MRPVMLRMHAGHSGREARRRALPRGSMTLIEEGFDQPDAQGSTLDSELYVVVSQCPGWDIPIFDHDEGDVLPEGEGRESTLTIPIDI